MNWQAEVLYAGTAAGEVLRLDRPISFWGGVDPVTSEIVLGGHPQNGQFIEQKILVIPQLIGSSSSSAVMLELIYKNKSPAALILGGRDAILPMGVVVARQMQWQTIPVLMMSELPFATGTFLRIDRSGVVTTESE